MLCFGCGGVCDPHDLVIDEDDDGRPVVACCEACLMAFWDAERRAPARDAFDPIAEDTED